MARYWLIALALHGILFTVLLVRFDWWESEAPGSPPAIQATIVDEAQLSRPEKRLAEAQAEQEWRNIEEQRSKQELEMKRRQEAEKRRQEAEKERKRAEEEQRRKIEEQRERERAERQRRIEQEKEARRKAEEQRRQEAERRRREEERKRMEEEKKRKAEEEARRKKLEQEKREREEAERKRVEAEKRRAAELKRREEALRSQLAAEEQYLEGEVQRKNQALIKRYMKRIESKVKSRWLEPPAARSGMSCILRIRLSPSGEVLVVATVKSSGDPVFDRSVENAVRKASPLPLPPDPAVLPGFPELNFNFKK